MGLFDDLMPAGDSGQPSPARQPRLPSLDPLARDYVIKTVLGEAANEPEDGQAAVAAVIRNRRETGKYGPNALNVVLAPGQFEPWMTADGRRRMQQYNSEHPAYQKAGTLVDRVFEEGYDPTNGATHFFAPAAQAALGRNVPKWATGEPTVIGGHNFYAPEGRSRISEVSSQSRQPAQPIGLFNDLLPSGAGGRSPEVGPDSSPAADTGGRFTDNAGTNFRVAREGAAAPVGKMEAFGKGLARGVTFNFIDELNAMARAGGLDPNDADGINAAIGLIKGGYRLATGDKDADATYRAEVSKQRADQENAQSQQPGMSLAGELGGALATIPFSGGAAAATLPARAAQGARVGAAYGALSGAGEGTDLQSRATGGLVGGATGAALGTIAPVAVEGVLQGARGIAAPFGQAAQMVRGIRDPEAEAARRVTGALQRDASVAGGPAGISPADFVASRNAGGPAAIMDLGGETTRGLARSAANTSPEGRQALNKAINDRFESQSERVAGWLDQTFGSSNTGATREALQTAARNANQPAYSNAFAQGRAGIWDQDLAELSRAPIMQDAIKAATKQAQNRSAPDVGKGGNLAERWVSPSGKPTLEFWDLVKRQIDQEINVAKRAGRSEDVMEATKIKDLLVSGKLDQAVPSYAAARQGAARFFGANDALEAGEKFLTSNAPLNDARRALGQMSQPERDLFREGFVQTLVSKIEATGDRRNVLNSIAQSPKAQQQIEMVMGPQKAREFESMLRVEGVMDLARGAVQGNSTTARQLTELGLAGGAYGLGTGGNVLDPNPTAIMNAALVWGAAKGKGAIDKRVAQKVAEMLASNDPGVLRKGIQIVSRNQSALNSLRAFDTSVARSGTQQAPGLPAIQSMGIGRAENDQPQVSGP